MDVEMKRGQISVWVILGLVLVASVALFFSLDRDLPEPIRPPGGDEGFDVQTYLESCSKVFVEDALEVMLPQGGFIDPQNTVIFDGKSIAYSCENIGFYEPCIQQHPMLLNEIGNDLKSFILPKIDNCLDEMKIEFEKFGNKVEYAGSASELGINFIQDKVLLNVGRKTTIEKNGEVREFDSFEIEIAHPAYNLIRIASEIARQEATYCYFEFVGYSALNPRYEINKFVMSDSSTVYRIVDSKTGMEMNTAIRGCAIPAGF